MSEEEFFIQPVERTSIVSVEPQAHLVSKRHIPLNQSPVVRPVSGTWQADSNSTCGVQGITHPVCVAFTTPPDDQHNAIFLSHSHCRLRAHSRSCSLSCSRSPSCLLFLLLSLRSPFCKLVPPSQIALFCVDKDVRSGPRLLSR